VVTSASLLVNTPGFDDAVRRVSALGARLGTGLHFNLTMGAPVSLPDTVRSLVDRAGRFLPLARLVRRALAGGVRPEEVRREAEAQFVRLAAAGLRITHADSHRHVHALPWVRGALAAAATDAGVPVVRRPLEPFLARPITAAGAVKRLALAVAWAMPVRRPRHGERRGAAGAAARAPKSVRFRGLALSGGPGFATGLRALLDALPEGTTELMVHPGRADQAVASWDSYVEEREVELEGLLSAPVRDRLRRGDFELTHFGALD